LAAIRDQGDPQSVAPNRFGRAFRTLSENCSCSHRSGAFPNLIACNQAYTEYDKKTCKEISPGNYKIPIKPKHGSISTQIIGRYHLGNGDCPGSTYTFKMSAYTWTDANSNPCTNHCVDNFTVEWYTPDGKFDQSFPMTATLTKPVNFHQVGPGVARSGGVLHFDYEWSSSSGNLGDLPDCQVGERVSYPGANPFVWPSPPYHGSTQNPTILWVPATDGAGQDNHSHQPFLQPYVANAFNATQNYRYRCSSSGPTNFRGWTNIIIARSVRDSTGRGCYGYTVTKSGARAAVSPLPGVPPADCRKKVAQPRTNPKNSIGMSVSLPAKSVSLNAPIFFDITVVNRGAETVAVDLGLDRKANLQLTIRNPAGSVITRTLGSSGFGRLGVLSLSAQGEFTERLLLNEWYEPHRPGIYRIKVTLLDDSVSANGAAGSFRPSADFSVDVGPRDPDQLELTSKELAELAIAGPTLEKRMEAANALSYVLDPVAVPSLVRVLRQGSLVAHYGVDGLARIGGPEAMAALVAAEDHADEEVRIKIRNMLGLIRLGAPGALRPMD
jgi:hypothetical protein